MLEAFQDGFAWLAELINYFKEFLRKLGVEFC